MYVSLFGVQTVDQLHSEVVAAAAPELSKASRVISKGSEIVAGLGWPWALAGGIPSVLNAMLKREIKPSKTLVFDDLERSDLTLKDLLGGINFYVEHLGFRVVVIAHDETLATEFLTMKEKIFGQSIRVEPQVEGALYHFIERIEDPSAKRLAIHFKYKIQDVFISSNIKSLRVLRHAVEDLTRLYSVLRKEHLEKSTAMEELTKCFVAFQLEVRAGNLKAKDLFNRRGVRIAHLMRIQGKSDDVPNAPPLVTADNKYPDVDLEAGMLNDTVLHAMLIEGRFPEEEIRASIDNSPHFIVPSAAPPWKVVTTFDKLDDVYVEDAVKRMQEQFEKREITDSGTMLHIFALRMMMAENGITDRSIREIADQNNAYIDQLLKEGRLPAREAKWRWYDEFERSYDGFGYWVSEVCAPFFDETWKHLLACREAAFQNQIPNIAKALLDLVATDQQAFFEAVSSTNNGPNPYATIPVLYQIDPEAFVDNWLSSDRRNWRYISYAIENRYSANQLENDLSLERDWALSLLKELDQRAANETGFRALRIKRIRPKILVEQAQSTASVEFDLPPINS